MPKAYEYILFRRTNNIMKDTPHNDTKADKKKYWYIFTVFKCPICDKENVRKNRVYNKKPNGVITMEIYDYCQEVYV
jgi:hypothetical protein